MTDFYWVATGTTATDAAAAGGWSTSSGGSAQSSWPGSSPTTTDNFYFDANSNAPCIWGIASVESIVCSLTSLFTAGIQLKGNVALKGLQLNTPLTLNSGTASSTLTFSSPLSGFRDSASKDRFVLNGQKANVTGDITYKFQGNVYLDDGPYQKIDLNSGILLPGYNVPTSTVHDNADDGFAHVKGAFITSGGTVSRSTVVPNRALDSAKKFKIDTTTFTYAHTSFDAMLSQWWFRGITLPVSGSTTYGGGSPAFQAKHHSIVIFASSAGDKVTITSGLTLDCYDLEIRAGARLVSSSNGDPVTIRTQKLPTINGGWSFEPVASFEFVSPRNNPVLPIVRGGTGLKTIGTAGQVLKVNSSANALEYGAVSGGSGTVTSVATSAPITGGTITATGTIGISAATTSAAGSMSSADKTKLDGIEASADVTDATNVAAAGALMDSELTDLAGVKGVTISTLQVKPSEGAFANGDKTKLDGIAANATAYADANAQQASLGVALTTVTLGTTVSGFTSGAYTIAPLNNVVKDVTSAWDGSGYYFTAPADGIYHVTFNASIQGLTTLSHVAITRLYKDTGSGFNFIASGSTARQSGAVAVGNVTLALNTGDKLALYVYHDGGSSKNLLGDNIAPNYTMMSIRMVGL
tara:strand:- start:1528 stop:3444 length:1917 start_codon:yes stop_codon:yes gene_type:complete